MNSKDKLYIIIPAYNESATIEMIIDQWYPIVEKIGNESRLVVIDDGSKDDTYNIMLECAKDRPAFVPMTKENSGHGGTVLYGYRVALENEADYVFQTDSDGQTIPEEFYDFWEQRNDFDLVIGQRKQRGDGFSRLIVSRVLKIVLKLCFGVSTKDANTPFRLINADKLKKVFGDIPKDFFLSNVLLVVLFEKRKYSIKYIPITFKPRQGGVNSINLKKILGIGLKAVKDFRKINKRI